MTFRTWNSKNTQPAPMILLIDNYDSFTYNIVQTIGASNPSCNITVTRNDEITLADIDNLAPTHLIISAGPGHPDSAGISLAAVRHLSGRIPILGICLGHQCIAQAFGARVTSAPDLMHGKTSIIRHDGRSVFKNVVNPVCVARYHSLTVDTCSLPENIVVSAMTRDERVIMGVRHRSLPIEGVQFHPDSYLSPEGSKILENFLAV